MLLRAPSTLTYDIATLARTIAELLVSKVR
jgi:hypothetical protein